MHQLPSWLVSSLSESIGQKTRLEPDDLLEKLGEVISSPEETTNNQLQAIDMLMKHHQMLGAGNITAA